MKDEDKVKGYQLTQRQGLDLDIKIRMSDIRIKDFIDFTHHKNYVSFSGGKDSTVLLDMVWKIDPDIKAVFVNTGLEFPEIVDFVKTKDVKIIRPKKSFYEVVKTYGIPVISKAVSMSIDRYHTTKDPLQREYRLYGTKNGKGVVKKDCGLCPGKAGVIPKKWRYLIDAPFKCSERCCHFLKKAPTQQYYKETGLMPFTGEMAADSNIRKRQYMKHGCNQFNKKIPKSTPLGFWTDQDIWKYIKKYKIEYSTIYDMGYQRTGCIWCLFGIQRETEPNRLQMLKKTHPQLYRYCINELGLGEVCDYINVRY